MKGIRLVLSCAIATLIATSAAFAGSDINVDQPVQPIVEQQHRIREEISAQRNGWDEVPAMKRSAVLRDQDQVFMLLEGKQTIRDLNQNQQVQVANLLESINAAVTGAEDQRKICTRERKVGSNFTQRVCRTVGQMRMEREATRTGIERSGNLRRTAQPMGERR